MNNEPPRPDSEIPVAPGAAEAEPTDDAAPAPAEVAFVVPAAVCEAIDTADQRLEPQPDSSADRPDRALEAIANLGQTLNRKLDALQALFEREVRAEANREKVVDRLHAELQEYKQDLVLKVLRPVFLDLIQLHDDIGKMLDAQACPESASDGDVGRLLNLMRGYQQGIEDILYRQGVEPFQVEHDAFDPKRQRAVATTATDDPSRDKTIASRLRRGFQSDGKIIRPEIVSVFTLKPRSD